MTYVHAVRCVRFRGFSVRAVNILVNSERYPASVQCAPAKLMCDMYNIRFKDVSPPMCVCTALMCRINNVQHVRFAIESGLIAYARRSFLEREVGVLFIHILFLRLLL